MAMDDGTRNETLVAIEVVCVRGYIKSNDGRNGALPHQPPMRALAGLTVERGSCTSFPRGQSDFP